MKYSQILILVLSLIVPLLLFSGCGQSTPAPIELTAAPDPIATITPAFTQTVIPTLVPLPTLPASLGQTAVLGRGFAEQPVVSPDGKLIALPSSRHVVLFDGMTLTEKFTLDSSQRYVQFSENDQFLIAHDLNRLTVFDLERQKQVFYTRLKGNSDIDYVATSTEQGLIAAAEKECPGHGSCRSHFMVWRLGTTDPLYTIIDDEIGNPLDIRTLEFSPDGQWLAVAEANGQQVMVVDSITGKVRWNLRRQNGIPLSVQFSPDGKTIVSGGDDASVVLWSLSTGQVQSVFKGFRDNINSVRFSQDGTQVIASLPDRSTFAINLKNGLQTILPTVPESNLLDDFVANQGFISSNSHLVYSSGGSLLVTESGWQAHNSLQIWNAPARKLQAIVRLPALCQVAAIALTADGSLGVSVCVDGQLAVWETRSGTIVKQANVGLDKGSFAKALAFSGDGKLLAFAEGQGLELWEIDSMRQVWRQAMEIASPTIVAFSTDGGHISVVEVGGTLVEMHEANSGQRIQRIQPKGLDNANRSVALQGNLLAAKAHDDQNSAMVTSDLQIFDLSSSLPLQKLAGIKDYFTNSIAISPDQNLAAVTDGYGRSWIWGLKSGELLYAFQKEDAEPISSECGRMMTFSPDGQELVINDAEGKLIFWDVRPLLGYERTRQGVNRQLPTIAPPAKVPATPTAIPEPGPVLTLLTPPAPQPQAIGPENLKQIAKAASWGSGTAVRGSWALDERSFTVVGSMGMFSYGLDGKPMGHTFTTEPLSQIVTRVNGTFAVSSPLPALHVLDGQGKILQTLPGPFGKLVSISQDGRLGLIEEPQTSRLQVWNLQKNSLVSNLYGYYSPYDAAAIQPGNKFVAGANRYSVRLWEVESGRVAGTFGPLNAFPAAISFSPDGQALAAVSQYGQLNVWDITSHKLLFTLAELERASDSAPAINISSMAFGQNADSLMLGSSGGKLYWIDLKTNKVFRSDVCGAALKQLKVSPGGSKLLIIDAQAGLQVWDIQTKKLKSIVDQHLADFKGLAFQQDGRLAAWGGNTLWDINLMDLSERVINVGAGILASVSQDGAKMAVINGVQAQIWDGNNPNMQETLPVTPLEVHQFSEVFQGFYNASFSPDGRMLALVGSGNTWVWDLKANKPVKKVEMPFLQGDMVAWRADSQLLAFEQPWAWRLSIANPDINGWILLSDQDWNIIQFVFHPNGLDYATVAAKRDRFSNQFFYNIGLGRLPEAGFKDKLILSGTQFSSLAYSPDGRLLAAGTTDGLFFGTWLQTQNWRRFARIKRK